MSRRETGNLCRLAAYSRSPRSTCTCDRRRQPGYSEHIDESNHSSSNCKTHVTVCLFFPLQKCSTRIAMLSNGSLKVISSVSSVRCSPSTSDAVSPATKLVNYLETVLLAGNFFLGTIYSLKTKFGQQSLIHDANIRDQN